MARPACGSGQASGWVTLPRRTIRAADRRGPRWHEVQAAAPRWTRKQYSHSERPCNGTTGPPRCPCLLSLLLVFSAGVVAMTTTHLHTKRADRGITTCIVGRCQSQQHGHRWHGRRIIISCSAAPFTRLACLATSIHHEIQYGPFMRVRVASTNS